MSDSAHVDMDTPVSCIVAMINMAPVKTLDGTCTRDPNMNLIIQYGLLGLVLGLGLGLGLVFILQNLAPPGTTVHVPTAVKTY